MPLLLLGAYSRIVPRILLCPCKGSGNPLGRPRSRPGPYGLCSSSTGNVCFPVCSGNSSWRGEMNGEGFPKKGHRVQADHSLVLICAWRSKQSPRFLICRMGLLLPHWLVVKTNWGKTVETPWTIGSVRQSVLTCY